MTRTTRLNDLQLVLLAGAAARDNASLIPLPANCTQDVKRIAKAVTSLLRRALVEGLPVTDSALAWRRDGDTAIGLFITQAGRDAIGSSDAPSVNVCEPDRVAANPAERPTSKIGTVVCLLQRNEGATLTEMVEATGWLPHTTRAALTGLKKKGHLIEKSKRDDITCYRVAVEA